MERLTLRVRTWREALRTSVSLMSIESTCTPSVVLGSGKPFFAGPRPPLRLKASERMDADVIRLAYVPA